MRRSGLLRSLEGLSRGVPEPNHPIANAVWESVCEECAWRSGPRTVEDEANAMGKLHEQDTPGHLVTLHTLSPK